MPRKGDDQHGRVVAEDYVAFGWGGLDDNGKLTMKT